MKSRLLLAGQVSAFEGIGSGKGIIMISHEDDPTKARKFGKK